MDNLPDLLTGGGVFFGSQAIALVTIEATSERGHAFLLAYYDAIDRNAGGTFYGEPDDDDFEIQFLSLTPKEFDLLKRQASLAPLSLVGLYDYPGYDSFAYRP